MFGLGVRFILVLRPLNRVYQKYRSPGKLKIWKIPIPFTDKGKSWRRSAKTAKDTLERAKEVSQQKGLPGGDSGDPCMKKQDPMTCIIERAKAAARR